MVRLCSEMTKVFQRCAWIFCMLVVSMAAVFVQAEEDPAFYEELAKRSLHSRGSFLSFKVS